MAQDNNAHIQTPPQFLEGERAILGGLLIDNDALPKVLATLTPEDFYREAHRNIFKAILDLFNRNEPVDLITLTAGLKEKGVFENVGGAIFISELIDAVPSAANIVHYAKVVKEKAILRQLISASTEISTRCYEDQSDVDEFLDEAEQILFRVGESRIGTGFHHIQELMKTSFATIESLYERKENITGVSSGFHDLDGMTAGFQNSDLIIVAGRPSMGKTSLALNIGMNAATESNIPTAIFSLEMSKEQIALRILCSKAKVNLKSLRTGYLTPEDWARLTLAVGSISDSPLYVDDTPAISTIGDQGQGSQAKKRDKFGPVNR